MSRQLNADILCQWWQSSLRKRVSKLELQGKKAIHNVAKYCAKMYAALEAGDSMAIASNGYKFVSQYLALEEHAVAWDPDDTK